MQSPALAGLFCFRTAHPRPGVEIAMEALKVLGIDQQGRELVRWASSRRRMAWSILARASAAAGLVACGIVTSSLGTTANLPVEHRTSEMGHT